MPTFSVSCQIFISIMLAWNLFLPVFVFSQVLQGTNSLAVRQLGFSGRFNPWPLLTTLTQIPRAAMGATIDVTSTGGRSNTAATVPATTSEAGSINGGQATIGNSAVNVLRRGIGFIEDWVVAALGGVAATVSALENVTDDGELYLGNLNSSAQRLVRRLLNSGYNVADGLVEDFTSQATISPSASSGTANFRPARFFTTGNSANGGGRTFSMSGEQRSQLQDDSIGDYGIGLGDGLPRISADVRQQPQSGIGFKIGEDTGAVSYNVGGERLQIPGNRFGFGNFAGNGGFALAGGPRMQTSGGRFGFGSDFQRDGTGTGGLRVPTEDLGLLIQRVLTPFANTSADGTSTGIETDGQSEFSSDFSPNSALTVDSSPANVTSESTLNS